MFFLPLGECFYACEESKIVYVTPVSDFGCIDELAISLDLYSDASSWKEIVSADGSRKFFEYRHIDEVSPEFKARQRAVEFFLASGPDNSVKIKYYSRMTCFGMSPASKNMFAKYCHIHHCYEYKCLSLYAYQAYLLQPSDLIIEKGSVHEAILQQGRKEEFKRMAPKSEKNFVKKLGARQLGLR